MISATSLKKKAKRSYITKKIINTNSSNDINNSSLSQNNSIETPIINDINEELFMDIEGAIDFNKKLS